MITDRYSTIFERLTFSIWKLVASGIFCSASSWWVMWCLTAKKAESLELQRISESAYYAGSGQDFFSPLREIRFFHHFEEDQEQLFGGLVSAQLDGAVPEPEPPLVGPLWRQWLINYSKSQNLTTFMALLSTLHSKGAVERRKICPR